MERQQESVWGKSFQQYSIQDSLANVNRGARPKKRDHPKTAVEGSRKSKRKQKTPRKLRKTVPDHKLRSQWH